LIKTRIIPCLLLKGRGLVKTIKFKDPTYVGDPLNAVRIFNEKEVDELIFLDITASGEKRGPQFDLIRNIATECFMPFCYGGGIKTVEDIKKLFFLGAEKVSINSFAIEKPDFIKSASNIFGSQSIVAAIDVKKNLFGKYKVYNSSLKKMTALDPVSFAVELATMGAGEIFLNSVDRDGTFEGYDIDLIKALSSSVNVPVIACGGAGKVGDFARAVKEGGASAVAAGSMMVFHGKHKAVLISYPAMDELEQLVP
jgi:cyclase